MLSALLLSLVLHVLLLFFVRFAPPSWGGLAGGSSPLNVFLDIPAAEVEKPSAIVQASQNPGGTAPVGARNNNPVTEQTLAAADATPTETPRTSLPEDFTGKEVMTVEKSTQVYFVEKEPDLLATKIPEPEKPEDKQKSYAPAPGVAAPETTAAPPVERMASTEPVPGETHEKVIYTQPAQAKPPEEKQASLSVPPPVKVEEPAPVKAAEPEPARAEAVKPVEIAQPKPVEVEKPMPPKAVEPEPVKAAPPPPVKAVPPPPAQTKETESAKTEAAPAPTERSVAIGKSDVLRAPASPAYNIPSLAELSLNSARRFASDEGRKIQFGERRKTVGLKEPELRYALYVESVRLKLQRIGALNYPAAAARDNLYGTLSVILSIRSDGSLEDFSIIEPSPYEVLNKGAERIARMCAPFSPLPDNIKRDTDILNIRINWSFSRSSQTID